MAQSCLAAVGVSGLAVVCCPCIFTAPSKYSTLFYCVGDSSITIICGQYAVFAIQHVIGYRIAPFGIFYHLFWGYGINSFVEYLEKQQVKQTFSIMVAKILDELSENYKTIQPEIERT